MSKKEADGDFEGSKGSKGGDAKEENTILNKAIQYCWSNDFLDVFRNYFKEHAHKFMSHAEGTTEEHDLEWQDLFQDYLKIYEDTLSDFVSGEGFTIQEFYEEIAQAKETNKDPKVQLFIDCLLASCDYHSFYNVMVQMAKKELFKAESKESGVTDDAKGGGDKK